MYPNLLDLKEISYEQLKKIEGIKEAKACDILAAIELGSRINNVGDIKKLKISNTDDVYKYYKNKLANKKQEYFYCIYLDNQNNIIKDKLLFIGTLNYSPVHPREVFKESYI